MDMGDDDLTEFFKSLDLDDAKSDKNQAKMDAEMKLDSILNPIQAKDLYFMDTVIPILNGFKDTFFPWTGFILVWHTRRGKMKHIGDPKHHEPQIRCILEFIYVFVKGCMGELNKHWNYASIFESYYNNAKTALDPEDVKYKMCLSAVNVIGDKRVLFDNKLAVFKFIKANSWIDNIKDKNKKIIVRKFFLAGCRYEFTRIWNQLKHFYEFYVFTQHKEYSVLGSICDRNNVADTITRQDSNKIQGKCNWGPRANNLYDENALQLVCHHRGIYQIPKPIQNNGFEEAYMMLCIAIANKLNDSFIFKVKSIVNEINYTRNVANFYTTTVKSRQRCFQQITKELKDIGSPKAAKILDYCRCVITFNNIREIIKVINKKFRICKIDNLFSNKKVSNVYNYKYINLYTIIQDKQNKFIKLICEIRLTLHRIRDLDEQRNIMKQFFSIILLDKELNAIQLEVSKGNNNVKSTGTPIIEVNTKKSQILQIIHK